MQGRGLKPTRDFPANPRRCPALTAVISLEHVQLTARGNATQNFCEVVILVEPTNLLSIGQRNRDHVETHLGVNLPRSHVCNWQPVLWARASASNYLRTTKLVNIVLQLVVEPRAKCVKQSHARELANA